MPRPRHVHDLDPAGHWLTRHRFPLLVAVAVLGLGLRLDGFTSSLWLDEFGTLWVVEGSIGEAWQRAVQFQGQTPLYYLSAWSAVQILGESEASLRLPSLLFGLGATLTIGATARQVAGPPAALLAAALAWLAFPFVQESANARPYSLALFAAGMLSYGFARSALRGDGLGRLLWVSGGALLGWSQYVHYAAVSGYVVAYAVNPTIRARWPIRRFVGDTALQVALVMVALPQLLDLADRRDALSWLGEARHGAVLAFLSPFLVPMAMDLSVPKTSPRPAASSVRAALLWSLASQLIVLELLWLAGLNLVAPRYAMVVVVPASVLAAAAILNLSRPQRVISFAAFLLVNFVAFGSTKLVTGHFAAKNERWRQAIGALRALPEAYAGAPILFRSGFVEDDAIIHTEPSLATLSPLRSPGTPMPHLNIVRLPFRWSIPGESKYFNQEVVPRLARASVFFAVGLDPTYFDRLTKWIHSTWPGTFSVVARRFGEVVLLEFRRRRPPPD